LDGVHQHALCKKMLEFLVKRYRSIVTCDNQVCFEMSDD